MHEIYFTLVDSNTVINKFVLEVIQDQGKFRQELKGMFEETVMFVNYISTHSVIKIKYLRMKMAGISILNSLNLIKIDLI